MERPLDRAVIGDRVEDAVPGVTEACIVCGGQDQETISDVCQNCGRPKLTTKFERMWILLDQPLRREIWRRFLASPMDLCSRDLSEELREPQVNICYHLTVLLDAGAIELARKEPRGGASVHYYAATAEFDRQRVLEEIRVIDGEVR